MRKSQQGRILGYISCFSGIGGFEASQSPLLYCEIDPEAQSILAGVHESVDSWGDIETLSPPHADVVVGGWPCQDISIAGKQAGLTGLRSRLLLSMLDVASSAGAHTVVAENVTNLLRLRNGLEFKASLDAIHEAGFPVVSWRVVNAREFGLPQHRQRLLIVASKHRELAEILFQPVPSFESSYLQKPKAAGFYWTAGIHSINYSNGYLPTIKIGSSIGIASPPAVHYGDVVRQISAEEALRLQGFDFPVSLFKSDAAVYRMTGNAVAKPIGRWLIDAVLAGKPVGAGLALQEIPTDTPLFDMPGDPVKFHRVGISVNGSISSFKAEKGVLANNLQDFLNLDSEERLSARASSGLLARLSKSGQRIPDSLQSSLKVLSKGGLEDG